MSSCEGRAISGINYITHTATPRLLVIVLGQGVILRWPLWF